MNGETDFLKLYRELRVQPGCTLHAFKQAYRRRVAELHPDRMRDRRHDSETLKELNRHYAATLGFHRLHGRLPGAPPAPPARFAASPHRQERVADIPRSPPPEMPRSPPNRWWLLGLSLVAIIPLWALLPDLDNDASDSRYSPTAPGDDPSTRAPGGLELGMEATAVAALLGVPIGDADKGEHWIYGPSWVRFECGEVVDWYSSVMHPLPVTNPRPAASDHEQRAIRPPRRCATRPRQESMAHPAAATIVRHSGTV